MDLPAINSAATTTNHRLTVRLDSLPLNKPQPIEAIRLTKTCFGDTIVVDLADVSVFLSSRIVAAIQPQLLAFIPGRYSLMFKGVVGTTSDFEISKVELVSGEQCKRENKTNNLNEVCGLFTYTWMPFNLDFFPVKQMYLFEQLFGAHFVYMVAGLAAWMVLESVEHIASRTRHVTHLFDKALNAKDCRERRNKFNSAVRYHVAVLGLEDKLNKTFSVFMFTHMVMTGVIMGYGVYAYMKGKNLSSFLLAIGWMIGLLMDCHSGQRIQDESDLLRERLYQANWSYCEPELKKDIRFVMMRCQSQMILKAASFGIMDHRMFLAVLKVSYSYINLMNRSENRDG